MIDEERLLFLKTDFVQGFIRTVGYKAVSAAHGRFESRLDVTADHLQQDGFVHAGVIATMADHTAGYAAYTTVPADVRILTVEFKINFLRPAIGDRLTCVGTAIREGRTVVVTESEVFAGGPHPPKRVAKAMLTMMAAQLK